MSIASETHLLADVIDHFVAAEQRDWADVQREVTSLSSQYQHVMKQPLPELSDGFTTNDRVEALRTMRHYPD